MYSREELLAFAARAATIDERLSCSFEELPGRKEPSEAAQHRLALWCRQAANGDWHDFSRRLKRDSLNFEQVLARLSAVRLKEGAEWFGWLYDAEWVSAALTEDMPESSFLGNMEGPLPFENLFYALVSCAVKKRDESLAPEILTRIPIRLSSAFTHDLLKSLTRLCEELLYNEFCRYRTLKEQLSARSVSVERDSTLYREFITELRAGALRDMFARYPVMLRLVASITRQWMEFSSEFFQRLVGDLEIIRGELDPEANPDETSTISIGHSDLHNFGRSVCIVKLSHSRSVIYKPRDVHAEKGWNDFLEWLNSCEPPCLLRTYTVIPRNGYGWCEQIQHRDVEDANGMSLFFRRAAALLALCYTLNGKDMHAENLIADGEHPVLVDLEMLFHPGIMSRFPGCDFWKAQNLAVSQLDRSILVTGLLPSWLPNPDSEPIKTGGLHDRRLRESRIRVWTNVNSDQMIPMWAGEATIAANVPTLEQRSGSLVDFSEEFINGCERYLLFLLAMKHQLPVAISVFREAQIRVLLKPTQFYVLLINRLRDFRNMSDGAEWSAHLEFTSRFSTDEEHDRSSWSLAGLERSQLSDLNVPYFSRKINEPSKCDAEFTEVDSSPFGIVQQKIRRFNDEEIQRELRLLRVSVATLNSRSADGNEGLGDRQSFINFRMGPRPLSQSTACSVAYDIATSIRDAAIRQDRSAAWIGLRPAAGDSGWQYSALGSDLYSGTPGIAILFAALFKLNGEQEWYELAQAALAPWRYILGSSGARQFARLSGIGGAGGLGSLVYSLITVSILLEDRKIQDDALIGSTLITEDLIRSDKLFDVVGGAAGAILSLLKLYRICKNSAVLECALSCGQHLLRSRPPRDRHFGVWHQPTSEFPLTGFSHGAAGFAYALASLATASGDNCYLEAACDCRLYEQTMYSHQCRNWKDLRHAEELHAFSCQWCHGAAGICIARIGMLKYGGEAHDGKHEVEHAIETVRDTALSDVDTLCCGNMGRVEALIEVAKALGRADLLKHARQMAQVVLIRANRRKGFGWVVGGDSDNIGFFTGAAGLGYSLLRCAHPDDLPCILMWE